MKGLFFIVLIYIVILSVCIVTKIIYAYFTNSNKKGSNPAPKIYYVTSNKNSKKRQNNPTIPIKESIIEKEKD